MGRFNSVLGESVNTKIISSGLTLVELISIAETTEKDARVFRKDDVYYISMIDPKAYSDDEYDTMINEINDNGYRNYMSTKTILECIENLRDQTDDESIQLMQQAVDYYFKNDAFYQH